MIISRFGVELVRITEKHIELVRQKRNTPSIRDFMEYREYITEDMQQKWFHSLSFTDDFYFVIKSNKEQVGLIHTSSIDWDKKEGHSGLFVWNEKLLGTHIPVLASLNMVDFFFCFTHLDRIYAKVMASNEVAVRYNEKLGFKLLPGQEGKAFQQYVLEKSDYRECAQYLHDLAKELGNENFSVQIESDLLERMKEIGAMDTSALAEKETFSVVY